MIHLTLGRCVYFEKCLTTATQAACVVDGLQRKWLFLVDVAAGESCFKLLSCYYV